METTGDTLFQVKKERSYISGLVTGCSYGFKHLGMLLRYMWPSLLLTTLFPLPFIFLFAAQKDAALRKWIELGYLPHMTIKSMRREIGQCANRSVISVLTDIIVLIFCALGIALLVMSVFFGISYWWGVVVIISVLILSLPISLVEMQISLSNLPILECFRSGYRIGFRNYGKLFAFEFLNALLLCIIIALGSIPYQIVMAAGMQAYKGYLMGDGWNLPVLYPVLFFMALYIMLAILLVTSVVFSFSRCLMWGSLVNEVPTEAEADR